MIRSFVLLCFILLFSWNCSNPADKDPENIRVNPEDTTTTTPKDTTTTTNPMYGMWIVHQHNIDFYGDEWDKEVIRYYQYDASKQWFLKITSDSVVSYQNVIGGTYATEPFHYRIQSDGRLLFTNGANLVATRLPVYYDRFGDTLTFVKRAEEGYWALEAEYQSDVDYLKEAIVIRRFNGTVPLASWNND